MFQKTNKEQDIKDSREVRQAIGIWIMALEVDNY